MRSSKNAKRQVAIVITQFYNKKCKRDSCPNVWATGAYNDYHFEMRGKTIPCPNIWATGAYNDSHFETRGKTIPCPNVWATRACNEYSVL